MVVNGPVIRAELDDAYEWLLGSWVDYVSALLWIQEQELESFSISGAVLQTCPGEPQPKVQKDLHSRGSVFTAHVPCQVSCILAAQ